MDDPVINRTLLLVIPSNARAEDFQYVPLELVISDGTPDANRLALILHEQNDVPMTTDENLQRMWESFVSWWAHSSVELPRAIITSRYPRADVSMTSEGLKYHTC